MICFALRLQHDGLSSAGLLHGVVDVFTMVCSRTREPLWRALHRRRTFVLLKDPLLYFHLNYSRYEDFDSITTWRT